MKHCPNPDCPFLEQYKMVAEFSDEIEFCRDCGTQLVAGEAPEPEILAVAEPPAALENRTLDLVALCTLESEADADFYKGQLEYQGIPVAIVRETAAPDDDADSAETPVFELQVLRSDLMRATYLLDTLAGAETEEIELDDENYDEDEDLDEEDDAPEHPADDQWADLDNEDEVESALPITHRVKDASSAPEPITASAPPILATGAASGRVSPFLLIVIGVIVVLVIWFLISNFVLA